MQTPVRELVCAVIATLLASPSWSAPGEDPIQLQKPVEYLQLPIGNTPKSQGLDTAADIPTALKAKIVRYEAKSFTDRTDGIYTDANVTSTVTTQANQKTCIQDVGSNVGSQVGAPKDQIVVLRGDLINVCR